MAIKQNNFYLRWQESGRAGKAASRRTRRRRLLLPAVLAAVCLSAGAAVTVRTAMLRARAQDIADWCLDPARSGAYTQTLSDQYQSAALLGRLDRANAAWQALDSQPDITSGLLDRVRAAAGSSVSVVFQSYDAASRQLVFDARSPQVIDIPACIRALEDCGVFSQVTYSGYTAQNDLYAIHLRCIVAAPQQQEAAP